MNNFLSEKVIEDILTVDKSILSELLSVNSSDLSLIARQKVVSSGKIDLLYLHKDELLLIELKVVPFYIEIINQLSNYEIDLIELQKQNKLINTRIKKIILVISARENDFKICKSHNCEIITYRIDNILSKYYENFKELTAFLKIRPGDFGVVRLGLIKNTLSYISEGYSIKKICELERKSEKTIRNRISIAQNLNLVSKFRNNFFLTDFGNKFIYLDDKTVDDRLSQNQIELISGFVSESPFYSQITYTIYSLIESVFVLSKTSYPVPRKSLEDYFVKSVGKGSTWKMPRARETATYIFSNYACELEYLVKVGNEFFITPKGIQAVLLLQLNRSIKLIESRK